MRYAICFSLLTVLLVGCKYKDSWETKVINKEFSMAVPSYLKVDNEVKPDAPFGYANRFRNIYTTVFSETKDTIKDSFALYYQKQIQIIKRVLEKPGISDSSYIKIGGATGVHTEIYGKMQGENIYYSHLLLETNAKYYQVCVWTRGEERKLKYGKDIEQILFSFKLLQP